MIFHDEDHPGLDFKKGAPEHYGLFAIRKEGGRCCMGDEKAEKRQPKRRSPALANRLIASPRGQHLASTLCESETSHGPDFVSFSEGMFCDMETKVFYPLCDEKEGIVVDECYHWETHSLVTGGRHVAKNYEHVEQWE